MFPQVTPLFLTTQWSGTIIPHHRWGNWSSERLKESLKVIQPASGRARIGLHTLGCQSPCLNYYPLLPLSHYGSPFFLSPYKQGKNSEEIWTEDLERFLAPTISWNQGRELYIHYSRSHGYFVRLDIVKWMHNEWCQKEKELSILILLRIFWRWGKVEIKEDMS